MPSVLFEELEIRMVKTEVSSDVQRKRDALIADDKCVRCEEPMKGRKRKKGCCPNCYEMGRLDVKARKTTKRELVQKGWWCDARKGRPLKNPLRRAS